jgi:hypothetical protein
MTTRRRPSPRVFDEKAYQAALADLRRLAEEGDDSDTSWQDNLPELPPLPDDPDEHVALVVSRKTEPSAPPKPTAGRRTKATGRRRNKAT